MTRGGDHSKDSINREVGTKINLRNLRKFDNLSGGFKDKDFTEEYSVSKTLIYLQRSKSPLPDK